MAKANADADANAKDEKPVKLTPQKAAAKLAEQVLPEFEARMRAEGAPEGAQAAPGDFGAKFKKALPHLLTGLIEAGAIAADGRLSEDEVKVLAGKLFRFLHLDAFGHGAS